MKKIVYPILLATVIFSQCNSSHNEEELITTVKINAVNVSTGDIRSAQFSDPDGEGGNPPVKFDTLKLDANSNYNLSLNFLDESVTPAKDLTLEIAEEAADHQVYYVTQLTSILIDQFNLDPNGLTLGTTAKMKTNGPANGNLNIVLKHKPGAKSSNDDITKGDTDVELPNNGFVLQIN
jgi:hypothetical protein